MKSKILTIAVPAGILVAALALASAQKPKKASKVT